MCHQPECSRCNQPHKKDADRPCNDRLDNPVSPAAPARCIETGLFPPYPGCCPFGWGLRPLLYDLCPRLPIYSYLPCIRTSETAVAHITAFVIRGDAVRNEDTLCESDALSQLHSLSLPGIIGHLNEHMAFIV